ncbi:MAG: DUF1624 domain-containing protein [Oligoflexia bacterium]|nr:DUF1624 domain-containing protein [Oligoflexia bacterium]
MVLMIFYHLAYNLNYWRLLDIPLYKNFFWFSLPYLIVFLFLYCSGISLFIAYADPVRRQKNIQKKFFLRWLKLTLCALLISLVTYKLFPDRWVYFGILHCICYFVGNPFFVDYPLGRMGILGSSDFCSSYRG